MTRRRWTLPIVLGLATALTIAMIGCDTAGTDLSTQITGFVQDFARQALAAWVL